MGWWSGNLVQPTMYFAKIIYVHWENIHKPYPSMDLIVDNRSQRSQTPVTMHAEGGGEKSLPIISLTMLILMRMKDRFRLHMGGNPI